MKIVAESKLKHALTMQSILGDSISFSLIHATHYEHRNKTVIEVALETEVATLQILIDKQWFGYNETILLNDVAFDTHSPVAVKLVLSPAICYQLITKEYELEHIIASLLGVKTDMPLSLDKQENWFIIEASQEQGLEELDDISDVASLKLGFKTSYFESLFTAPITKRYSTQERVPDGLLLSDTANFLESERLMIATQDNSITIELRSDTTDWNELLNIDEENRQITCYAIFPEAIALAQLDSIAIVLLNENYSQTLGAFELDYNSGQLRYRSTLLMYESFNKQELAAVLNHHLSIMEQYLPAIARYLDNL